MWVDHLTKALLRSGRNIKMASRRVVWGKSLVEKLAMLPQGAFPTKREDAQPGMRHWTKPLFSKRQLKELKRDAEAEGLAWP